MQGKSLLLTTALLLTLGEAKAQTDVTAQYISNAGFEECEVVANNEQGAADVHTDYANAQGTDYAAQGWQLVAQAKSANGGAVSYNANLKVQYSRWNVEGDPGPSAGPTGTTGNKGLCFAGNASVVYRQSEAITLPAGSYKLTVNVWARNGETSNPKPTQQVVNNKTGFLPEGGSDDDLIPAVRKSLQFKSNDWDTEVLEIELTKATTGRIQLSYGTSYFVVIDDLKLEYSGGVVTTALLNLIPKAKALNANLEDADLATAITAAQAFVADPTTQDDVTTQVETLYTAMSTALAKTTKVVNITEAYMGNASLESGKIDPWTWGKTMGTVGQPVNEASKPYIDGENVAEFANNGTNVISQTLTHLPAGYYAMDAKLNQKAFLIVGTNKTLCQGGSDALYLRVHPAVYQTADGGDLTIGAQASASFRIDNFRLFYGKDEASLLDVLLQDVKADAQAISEQSQFNAITGEELSKLQSALNGTDADAINSALNAFVAAKDAYTQFETAKNTASTYTREAYPYGSVDIYQQIQELVSAQATSAADATAKTNELNTLCRNFYISNAYCEGVDPCKDYTSSIAAANATGTSVATAWHKLNMQIRTDKAEWVNPKTKNGDKNVYGVTAEYYREAKDMTAYMYQTISGLPKGTYVLSITFMANTGITPEVLVNGEKVGELKGIGTYGNGGVYGAGWIDQTIEFEKTDNADLELRLQSVGTANFTDWYFDNLRLYYIAGEEFSSSVQSIALPSSAAPEYYDLSGRKVTNPSKGIYMANGKKVILK